MKGGHLTLGFALGAIVAAAVQHFSTGHHEATPSAGSSVALATPPSTLRSSTGVRPRLDALLECEPRELRRLLARFLPDATAEELEQLYHHWGPTVDHRRTPVICWKMLLGRWVDVDPQRALTIEKALDHLALNGSWCYVLWSSRDPLAALAAARQDDNPAWAIVCVLSEVARRHLPEALPLIDEFPHNEGILITIFSQWARSDLDAALARSAELPESLRRKVRELILGTLAETAPEKALALARDGASDLVQRLNDEAAVLQGMIRKDPVSATRHVLAMAAGKTRYRTMIELAQARARQDPEGTLAWAKTLAEGSEKQAVIAATVSQMDLDLAGLTTLLDEIGWQHASLNPQDIERVKSPTGGSTSYKYDGTLRHTLEIAIRSQAESGNLDPILHALSRLPQEQDTNETWVGRIAQSWANKHPDLLKDLFAAIPNKKLVAESLTASLYGIDKVAGLLQYEEVINEVEPEQRRNLVDRFSRRLSDLDAVAAVDWANNLTDPQERKSALRRGLRALSEQDTPAAMGAFESLEDAGLRSDIGSAIATNLAANDAPAAIEWITQHPDTEIRPKTYSGIVDAWFKQDPMATSEWVGQLEPGEPREYAINGLIATVSMLAHK